MGVIRNVRNTVKPIQDRRYHDKIVPRLLSALTAFLSHLLYKLLYKYSTQNSSPSVRN